MKRLGSCDSLMAICPNSTDEVNNQGENPMFEEEVHVSEKKRRLRVDQVKALEMNFEVENKLEPDRKVKLAQDLGLQPRQVAVWFQNRRARWKTKQLESDYGLLKANFDAMNNNYDTLKRDNQALLKEINELRSKVNNEDGVSNRLEEIILKEKSKNPTNSNNIIGVVASVFNDTKDGSSDDSDSSAIFNEDPTAAISSTAANGNEHHRFMDDITNCMNISFQFSQSKASGTHDEFVKIEERNLFGDESFFSQDQPTTLHWYCSHHWN